MSDDGIEIEVLRQRTRARLLRGLRISGWGFRLLRMAVMINHVCNCSMRSPKAIALCLNCGGDVVTPLNRDSDIVQEALQRTKLHMTQAGIIVSDDEVFEYLTNAVAAAKSGPKPDRQDGDGDGLLPCVSGFDQCKQDAIDTWNTRVTRDAAEGAEDVCSLQNPQGLALVSQLRAPSPQPASDAMREAIEFLISTRANAYSQQGGKLFGGFTVADDFHALAADIAALAPVPPADGAIRKDREAIARTLWISRGGLARLWDEFKTIEVKSSTELTRKTIEQCYVDADAILFAQCK